MVVWNEVAQNLTHRGVLTGYPQGPVSYPMYGSLLGGHCDAMAAHKSGCRSAWLNRTSGLFWFGHKVPDYWFRAFGDRRSWHCRDHAARVTLV
eukprot:1827490-Prymnesium_polylepis.1